MRGQEMMGWLAYMMYSDHLLPLRPASLMHKNH